MRQSNTTLWSEGGWTIEVVHGNFDHLIVCDPHGWNDNPLLVKGVVYWDFPYKIPQYVKTATLKVMSEWKAKRCKIAGSCPVVRTVQRFLAKNATYKDLREVVKGGA